MPDNKTKIRQQAADQIIESRKRSLVKTLTSAGAGALLYGLAAHSITVNHGQSMMLLGLGVLDGIAKTVGAYKYERWFSHLSIGRNMGTGAAGNPAHDHPVRSMFKAAGWFMLSTGMDALLAFAATHDKEKATNFMIYRGIGRLVLSVALERAWANCSWGATRISAATYDQRPSLPAKLPLNATPDMDLA
jgi:uncharacterized membrane protein